MTKRQLAWHRLIAPKVPDIIDSAKQELSDKPVGWQAVIRLVFWPQGFVSVMVLRERDEILYREHVVVTRKGESQPKFRPLCPLDPVK